MRKLLTKAASTILFICGDFNTSVGREHINYPDNIGRFTKGTANKESDHLLGIVQRNNLYITNTFFQHRLSHITTWQAGYTRNNRRNPYRTQIDFIIANRKWKNCNSNSRSYAGIQTFTDHRLIVCSFKTDWKRIFSKRKSVRNIHVEHLHKSDVQQAYRTSITNSINELPAVSDSQKKWNSICDICIKASEDVKPSVDRQTVSDDEVATLSEHRKNLQLLIQNCRDPNKLQILKRFRNKAKSDIRKQIRKQQEEKVLKQIELIENSKNDSRRMFQAVKVIQNKSSSGITVKNKEGNIVNSRQQQIEVITEYFTGRFNPENTPEFPQLTPKKLDKPFTRVVRFWTMSIKDR